MTATVRDYGLTGADSRRAVDLGLIEAEWFRPPIDAERLRALQVRTNARAARDTIMWLGLLAVFGYLAFRALDSWWTVPAFMAYGALYGGAGDERSFVDTGVTAWAGEVHDGLVDLGAAEGLSPGSARRVDHADSTHALYRVDADAGFEGAESAGGFVLSDGLCTHGRAHLAEAAVLDGMIECPKHSGCFDLRTGEALRFPATEPITLYDVAVRNGRVVSRLAPRQQAEAR